MYIMGVQDKCIFKSTCTFLNGSNCNIDSDTNYEVKILKNKSIDATLVQSDINELQCTVQMSTCTLYYYYILYIINIVSTQCVFTVAVLHFPSSKVFHFHIVII